MTILQDPNNIWGAAIANIGNTLGEALETGLLERGRRQKKQKATGIVNEALQTLQKEGFTEQNILNTLNQITSANIPKEIASPLMEVISPYLKEFAKQNAYMAFDENRKGRIFGDQQEEEGSPSPMEQLKNQQNRPPGDTPTTPQKESTEPSEVTESTFEEIIEKPTFEGEPISEDIIRSYERSPYQRDQETAQSLRSDLREYNKLKGKYKLETQKENRAAVREYSKPYYDITKLKEVTRKMDRLWDLVNNKQIGRTKNLGTFLNALIEGRDNEAFKTIFKTPQEQELGHLLRDLYNTKDIGGSNPSTREVLITLATLPDRFKTPEANAKIAEGLRNLAYKNLYKGRSVLSNLDKGLELGKFISTVEDEASQFMEYKKNSPPGTVLMITPEGELFNVKKEKVGGARKKAKMRELG